MSAFLLGCLMIVVLSFFVKFIHQIFEFAVFVFILVISLGCIFQIGKIIKDLL